MYTEDVATLARKYSVPLIYSCPYYVFPHTDAIPMADVRCAAGGVCPATPSAMTGFSDVRCAAGGVCPNDPLVFSCEINDAPLLQVTLPSGRRWQITVGVEAHDLRLPAGFSVDCLVVTPINGSKRNITITLSIEKAFLLDGGQITCDDTTTNNRAMFGCPLAGESSI